MREDYDFRKAHRGPQRQLPPLEDRAKATKVRITIMLDADVLGYFKRAASEPGALPYQTQINLALRDRVYGRPAVAKLLDDEEFIERVAERVAKLEPRSAGARKQRRSKKAIGGRG